MKPTKPWRELSLGAPPRLAGPFLGTDLPEAWSELVGLANPWVSCKLRSYWFAYLEGERVVAVGAIDPDWHEPSSCAWLGPTYVHPEFRGQSLQSKLIRARLELAREMPVVNVASAADVTNSASVRNLLNAGFKISGYDPEHKHLEFLWKR